VQLLRGDLSRALDLDALTGLLERARADERLTPVSVAWNEPRLLLEEGDKKEPEAAN
jgi:hypothetical protein